MIKTIVFSLILCETVRATETLPHLNDPAIAKGLKAYEQVVNSGPQDKSLLKSKQVVQLTDRFKFYVPKPDQGLKTEHILASINDFREFPYSILASANFIQSVRSIKNLLVLTSTMKKYSESEMAMRQKMTNDLDSIEATAQAHFATLGVLSDLQRAASQNPDGFSTQKSHQGKK